MFDQLDASLLNNSTNYLKESFEWKYITITILLTTVKDNSQIYKLRGSWQCMKNAVQTTWKQYFNERSWGKYLTIIEDTG